MEGAVEDWAINPAEPALISFGASMDLKNGCLDK